MGFFDGAPAGVLVVDKFGRAGSDDYPRNIRAAFVTWMNDEPDDCEVRRRLRG